jgi:hypothetical protein
VTRLLFAGLIVLVVPLAVILSWRWIARRRREKALEQPRPGVEEHVSSLLARESGTDVFPAVQDLPERPYLVKRTVAVGGTAPLPPVADGRNAVERIQALPPLKQAIVWSEVLRPPKAIRTEQDDPADQ